MQDKGMAPLGSQPLVCASEYPETDGTVSETDGAVAVSGH